MGIMTEEASDIPIVQFTVSLSPGSAFLESFLKPPSILAIVAKGISDLSDKRLCLAVMDIMTDNAVHNRRSMHERTVVLQMLMAS